MKEGDDVLSHINKLKTLAEQLDSVGAPVCEDDIMITLLGSLSDSYQFLITALESRSDTPSWELVTYRLLYEDMNCKEKGSGFDNVAQGQAFMANDSGRRKGRQVPKNSGAFTVVGSTDIGSPSVRCVSVRIRSGKGCSEQTLRSLKITLASFCFWLETASPNQVMCGWSIQEQRST